MRYPRRNRIQKSKPWFNSKRMRRNTKQYRMRLKAEMKAAGTWGRRSTQEHLSLTDTLPF